VGSAFAQLDVTYWLLALGVYAVAQCVSAVRWQMLAGTLGLGGRWWDYLSHYLIGMFFNLVLPTSVGGDVVRAWYLGGAGAPSADTKGPVEQAPFSPSRRMAAFLSVLADRVNGFAVLIVVACLAALCYPAALPSWIRWTVAGMGAACMLGLAALPALPWLRKTLPMPARLTYLFDGATLYLRDRRGLLAVTLLSVVVQLANVMLAWLVGEGLGLPIPPLYYGVLVPLVSILTLLPISLNGMGLREGGTVVLLAPLGISAESAVTLSLLIFAVYTTASLGGGVFYLFGRLPRFDAGEDHGGPRDPLSSPPGPGMEAYSHAVSVRGNSDQGRRSEPTAAA
jgi:uncharacterized membrane protein YbhN (UPF0104 family)